MIRKKTLHANTPYPEADVITATLPNNSYLTFGSSFGLKQGLKTYLLHVVEPKLHSR